MKKILFLTAVMAVIVGFVLVGGGVWGIAFTYQNIAQEKIVTPADAAIPNQPVRGPLTLKAQADIIRTHVLKTTGGQSYAEMPRQIPKLDSTGNPVLSEAGDEVMIPNEARELWVTALTLINALNLGIITYVFSGLIVLLGFISIWTGITFYIIRRSLAVSLK